MGFSEGMTKKIFILFGIVIILGLIALVVEKPHLDRFSRNEEIKIYSSLKTEDITAVEIEYFTQGTRLEKGTDGQWMVQSKKTEMLKQIEESEKAKEIEADKTKSKGNSPKGSQTRGKKKESEKDNATTESEPNLKGDEKYPADAEKIEGLLDTLTLLNRNTLVTSNPDKHDSLELGSKGLNVTLYNSKGVKVVKLKVGKQGPNLFSTFVRDENENNVYLVDEYLKGYLNVPAEGWKKKETPPPATTPDETDSQSPIIDTD